MRPRAAAIHARYFRSVIAFPDGAIVHHASCTTHRCQICTCGLLHDLQAVDNPAALYPFYWQEKAVGDQLLETWDQRDQGHG